VNIEFTSGDKREKLILIFTKLLKRCDCIRVIISFHDPISGNDVVLEGKTPPFASTASGTHKKTDRVDPNVREAAAPLYSLNENLDITGTARAGVSHQNQRNEEIQQLTLF